MEAESRDRDDLFIPYSQSNFITEVTEASKGPVILVIFSAGGLDISSIARDNAKVSAILWAGYPGAEGGRAIADVVYGRYNPGNCIFDGGTMYHNRIDIQFLLFSV